MQVGASRGTNRRFDGLLALPMPSRVQSFLRTKLCFVCEALRLDTVGVTNLLAYKSEICSLCFALVRKKVTHRRCTRKEQSARIFRASASTSTSTNRRFGLKICKKICKKRKSRKAKACKAPRALLGTQLRCYKSFCVQIGDL